MNSIDFTETYETPHVEIVEVQVEKGFAASNDPNTEGFGSWN